MTVEISTLGPRPVVAACIVDSLANPTRFLAARRSYPPALAGLFELPGGKVEREELPVDALFREIHEELGVELILGDPVPANLILGKSGYQSESPHETYHDPKLKYASPGGSQKAADSKTTAGFAPWPILENRYMWVWFAELAPHSKVPIPGSSHTELVWADATKALELPWIATNQPIIEACVDGLVTPA